VSPDTYLAVDVLYQKLQSASLPGGLIPASSAAPPASGISIGSATTVADQDNWSVRFRVHKDFYP
jgi:hypothetical protein